MIKGNSGKSKMAGFGHRRDVNNIRLCQCVSDGNDFLEKAIALHNQGDIFHAEKAIEWRSTVGSRIF